MKCKILNNLMQFLNKIKILFSSNILSFGKQKVLMMVNVDDILTRKTKYDDKNEYDGEI